MPLLLILLACRAPAPTEIPYDGLDQDGDGADLVDLDADGFPSLLACFTRTGCDCDDRRPWVNPGADDAPGDGVDADCDGDDPGPPPLTAGTSPSTRSPRAPPRSGR